MGLSMIGIVLFQSLFNVWSGSFNREITFWASKRLNAMNELLRSIKIIKIRGWESKFYKKITFFRDKELLFQYKSSLVDALPSSMIITASNIIILAVLSFMYKFNKIEQFTVVQFLYINLLLATLEIHLFTFFSQSVHLVSQAYKSLQRIFVSLL